MLGFEAAANALKAIVDRKLIRAPFSGRVGVRRVTTGQYVNEGDPLFQLQDDSKLYLSFDLGRSDSIKISVGNIVEFKPANSEKVYFGKVIAVDPNISNESGTKLVKASFDQHPNDLPVGTYGKILVTLGDNFDAFVIPAASIQHAPYGDSVFVVEEKTSDSGEKSSIANPIFIKVSDTRGDMVAIKEGLNEGQSVVTSGTFKLQKGTKLIINNSLPEKSNEFPTPKNS